MTDGRTTDNAVDRAAKAEAYFTEGYNCAQSVALAFADLLGADEETLKAVAAPFGGGMGRLREVCGAVSGMFMVAGLAKRPDTLDRASKNALYALEREMARLFAEQTGSIVCRELLLTRPHGDIHNSQKPKCRELVGIAARIAEAKIFADSDAGAAERATEEDGKMSDITATTRGEKAKQLYAKGYNCAQAVALAFADLTGTDIETVKLASAPFGGGMGRLGEVCGAVSGMLMTLSFLRRPNTLDPREKAALYAEERALAEEFRAAADSILCRDLLLMRAGRKEGRGLACPDLVALAVGILEEHENARSNK